MRIGIGIDTQDHSALFSSAAFRPEREYGGAELEATLNALCKQSESKILRVKGYLNASQGGSFRINCTENDIEFEQLKSRMPPMLNIIGQRLDRKKIKEYLII